MSTISDVAQRAGVSPATVSRVLQGASNVRPDTRQRVEQAIEELGYVPSAVAQSLRSKRTRSLALIVPDITNSFWTTIARGVEDAAQGHDYSILLYNTDENPARQIRCLEAVISQRVDGVIIAPYDSDARNLSKLRERNTPTVIVDRRIEGWNVDSVLGDSISGARALVQHLIGLGHRRIAVISGPLNTSTAEDRVMGYLLALAEAGIPLEPHLIRRGEFLSASGEELALQLLDERPAPTAIFAANNLIAMGVIDAAKKLGQRIPQDIALVCFDDLPNVSHIFPFLTVAVQPAYDMGMNAAQLLLSRLESEAALQPRQVVLPIRLIIRHSCGSQLHEGEPCILSLPLPEKAQAEISVLAKTLTPEEQRDLSQQLTSLDLLAPTTQRRPSDYDRSDVNRLLKALHHEEADRVPHLELSVTSRAVYEYVLEREIKHGPGESHILPEDQVEFALRLGIDAVPCDFSWRPKVGDLPKTGSDPVWLGPAPSLIGQLSHLERYLRAAQGTTVGVIAHFASFFDDPLLANGFAEALQSWPDSRPLISRLLDTFLEHQEKLVRAVCDRFASDLALVAIGDSLTRPAGQAIPSDLLEKFFAQGLRRLIAPAKEHGKLLLMNFQGAAEQGLPFLYDLGFDAVHSAGPELDNLLEVKKQWAGKLALIGGIPAYLMANGNRDEIEERVRQCCVHLAPGGGYVLGSSGAIGEGISPQNLAAMARAVHRYGRYGSLGQEV
jgi:LacI family transcriptional regulator